jgi:hypothetical protein
MQKQGSGGFAAQITSPNVQPFNEGSFFTVLSAKVETLPKKLNSTAMHASKLLPI